MATGQPPGTDPTKPWSLPAGQLQGQPGAESDPQNQRRAPNLNELTAEEREIMKKCESESFYKRCLPLSIGAMAGANFMVRTGRWAAHPRFAALPKMIIASGVAYIAGKLLYLPVCQEKILKEIPNSNLAASVRKARGLPEVETPMAGWEESPYEKRPRDKAVSDDYTPQEGLDDRFRPSMDKEVKAKDPGQEEKAPVTYEDLRKKNRQEYEDSLSKRQRPPGAPSYKESPMIPQKPWPDARDAPAKPDSRSEPPDTEFEIAPPPPREPPKRRRTNMWGDPIEE